MRVKMQRILGWHCRTDWLTLSDIDFARELFKEYQKHIGRPLIDPNE